MISRTIEKRIWEWIGKEKILILKGSRQVGKTTLMKMIQATLEAQQEKTIFFAIDQEKYNGIFTSPRHFSKMLTEQHLSKLPPSQKLYVFLDEFQYLSDAGNFLKVLFDIHKTQVQFIVSGSSSLEISKNIEFLTGRKIEFFIQPFSFIEFLQAKSTFIPPSHLLKLSDFESIKEFYTTYHTQLSSHLRNYLLYGGYPEVVTTDSLSQKKQIIKELITTYIQKDISGFLQVQKPEAFNRLIILLSHQIGNLINISELQNTLSLNHETINHYLDILQGTYFFTLIKPFFTNPRKQISKMPKVFAQDTGSVHFLRKTSMDTEFEMIDGSIIENFVLSVLENTTDPDNIFFYRTISKSEIDFIVSTEKGIIPIECKFQNSYMGTPSAFHSFSKDIPTTHKIIITQNTCMQKESTFYIPAEVLPFVKIELEK